MMKDEEDKDLRDYEEPFSNDAGKSHAEDSNMDKDKKVEDIKKESNMEEDKDDNGHEKSSSTNIDVIDEDEDGYNSEGKDMQESRDEDDEDSLEIDKKSMKYLGIAVGAIILLFAVFFATRYLYDPVGSPETLDDLHEMNLNGELEDGEAYTYQGFSFVHYDGLWYTQLERKGTLYNVPLHYGPKELDDIIIGGEGMLGDNEEIYITFDPESEDMEYIALSAAELSLSLAKGISINPVAACIKNVTDACFDRPIVQCGDEGKEVIYIRSDDKTAVVFDEDCVVLQGQGEEIVKATDRFLLYWYGIMDKG